jgi:DNA ligase-1
MRMQPLVERKKALNELLPEDTAPLYKILTLEEHGRALFSAIKKMDLEGVVARRKVDPYAPGTEWYKIKNAGYTQGEGRVDLFRPHERRRAERVSE